MHLVEQILYCVGRKALTSYQRANLRFYGGWYEQRKPSPSAQALAPTVLANFPRLVPVYDSDGVHVLRVACELAYALQIDPHSHLWHTYRPRGMPRGIFCEDPKKHGCSNTPCALQGLHDFFRNGVCPVPGCTVTPPDIIRKGQQKLVDTMLLADLVYSAFVVKVSDICVVSSDDDLWPGIRLALYAGVRVFHIHPKHGQSTPHHYRRKAGPAYRYLNL